MEVKIQMSSQLPYSPEPQLSSKLAQSGKPSVPTPHNTSNNSHRIYKEAKPATQSGDWHSHHWRMDWDILPKGHRWENPLMGWQSSADFMQGTHISFKTKEDAIRFAEKQGYEYFVQEPNVRKFAVKAY